MRAAQDNAHRADIGTDTSAGMAGTSRDIKK
jgi:hypothetical protein